MAVIIVTHLFTREEWFFVNDLSLAENVVNVILLQQKRTGELTVPEKRWAVKVAYDVKEGVSTITGKEFAYSEEMHLHARYRSRAGERAKSKKE